MIIPIRCMSCGKVVADKWEAYKKEVASGKAPKKVLNDLGITRYCCRSLFLTHVDLIEQISRFKARTVPVKSSYFKPAERAPEEHAQNKDAEPEPSSENAK